MKLNKFHRFIHRPTVLVTLVAWCIAVQSSAAFAEISISDTPLFITENPGDPNVFFEVDDSGSMDWEILTVKHWHFCAYRPSGDIDHLVDSNCERKITHGRWESDTNSQNEIFSYIYDNGDNKYPSKCNSGDNDNNNSSRTIESCGWTEPVDNSDWRIRSADFNVLYYNPDTDYSPWDGT